jgi:hypothetical protein
MHYASQCIASQHFSNPCRSRSVEASWLKKGSASGLPRIKAFDVKIQSNRSNPEAERKVQLQDYPGFLRIKA